VITSASRRGKRTMMTLRCPTVPWRRLLISLYNITLIAAFLIVAYQILA
jgi:hypothetical protein